MNTTELSPKIVILTTSKYDYKVIQNGFDLTFYDNTQDIISLVSYDKTSALGDCIKKFQKLLFLKNIHIKTSEYYDKQYLVEPYIKYTSKKQLEDILDVLELMITTKSSWVLEYLEYCHIDEKGLSREEFIKLACE